MQILRFLERARSHYSNIPYVREQAVLRLGGLGNNALSGQVARMTSFVRNNVTYVRDPINAEYVVSPVKMLQEISGSGFAAGDCDDHVMLLNSLLGAIGFPTKFVGVKLGGTGRWNHVISAVQFGGRWQLIDPCEKSGRTRQYPETLTHMKRFILLILAVLSITGCTMIQTSMVPKFNWYWSHDAKVQREENALHRRQVELYQAEQLTNTILYPDK